MSKISRRRDSYPQGALTVPPVREPHPLTNALICPPWLGPNHRRILSHEYGRLQSYAFPGQPIPYVFPQPDTYRQYPPMPRPPFDPGNPPSYAPPPPPSPQIQIHPDLLPAYLQSLSYDEARKTADRALREALRAERVRQANRQETPDPPRLGSMYGDQLISPLGSQHEQSDTSKTMVTKTHGNPPESCNDADSFSALPAELKVAIFGKLTALNDLDALASVNHGWHATFLGAQQAILQDFAAALISADVDLSEPIRAQHSEAMILALYTTPCPVRLLGETGELQKRLYNQIEAINEDWKANSFQTILQQFHLQDLRKLIRTHQEIQYLVQDFASIALSNFPVEGMEDHPMTLRALSQSERQSIFTAFYRWRRWCILFGWQPYLLQEIENTGRKLGQAYTFANPQADKFAADLTAWDLEALACVEEYASTRWSQFGKAIQADIIDRLPGGYVSEHLNDRDSYKLRVFDEYFYDGSSLAARGPRSSYEFLQRAAGKQFVFRTILDHWRGADNAADLGEMLLQARKSGPNADKNNDKMPAGWLWMHERFSNTSLHDRGFFGAWHLRAWGYVFWDYERMSGWELVPGSEWTWDDDGDIVER